MKTALSEDDFIVKVLKNNYGCNETGYRGCYRECFRYADICAVRDDVIAVTICYPNGRILQWVKRPSNQLTW